MGDGDDDAVGIFDLVHAVEGDAVFFHGVSLGSPGVDDDGFDAVGVEAADDVIDLAVSGIRAVFLEGEAEDDDFALSGSLAGFDHLFDGGVSDVGSHGVVDNSAVEDDLAVIAEFLCFVGEVVGVYADAVAADESGSEAEGVPFGVHAVDDFVGVDVHAVKDHGEFVHEGDVDIALAVLDDFDCLGGAEVGDGVGPDFDDEVVDGLDGLQGFLVDAGDDLVDVLEAVDSVAGVDSLGAVADLEVGAAFEPGFFLEDRDADVFGAAGIDGGFIDDDGTGYQVPAHDLGGADDGRQVGSVVGVDGCGNCDNMEFCCLEHGFVGGEVDGGLFDDLVSYFVGGILALFV